MPTKIQTYSQMADHAATQITGSYQGWTEFLQTAARLYKYPCNEQLMIYAQRPDATACAEYDFWNNRMGRYEYCLIADHKHGRVARWRGILALIISTTGRDLHEHCFAAGG